MELSAGFLASVLKIIWIDLLLSGDNAVVIALACRSLPERQRKVGIWLGASVAVLLRIFFALIITWLFNVPFLKVVGALLLVWIGVKLLVGEEEGGGEHVEASDTLWRAVRTIAIADAVMSLDNVLAIAAASHGNVWLFVFGLVVSIPLIILGAQLIMGIIERFPAFIWLGAGLLGWIAGEMLVDDPVVLGQVAAMMPSLTVTQIGAAATSLKAGAFLHYGAAFVGAAIVLAIGWWKRRPRHGDVSVR